MFATSLARGSARLTIYAYFLIGSIGLNAVGEKLERADNGSKVTLSLGIQFRDLWVSSNEDLVKEADIGYRSNTPRLFNLGVGYGDFMGTIKINIGSMQNDTQLYGKSEALDLQLNYYADRIGVDLFYQNYSGYYADYKRIKPEATDPKIRSDLSSQYWGTNFIYSFPAAFELRSTFRWSAQNPGWHAGFLLGASLSVLSINTASSFLTPTQELQNPDYSGYRRGDYINLSVMPGFAVTYAGRTGFYTSLIFMYGGGVTQANLLVTSGTKHQITDNNKVNLKIIFGQEFSGVFLSATFFFDYTAPGAFTRSTFVVAGFSAAADLSIGYRF